MKKNNSLLSNNNNLHNKGNSQLDITCVLPFFYPCYVFPNEIITICSRFNVQIIIVCLVLTFSAVTMAGIPLSETVVCPIGGEKFEITRTLSCTTMGLKMSLAPDTSCGFVTHVPQCPTNKLPMYKEFSKKEKVQLETYLKTPEFKAIKDKSRFYIAYKIEQYLLGGSIKKEVEYWMLLQGVWFDTTAVLKDISYMNEFRAVASKGIPEIEKEEQPYYWAMMAYFDAITGKKEQAQKELEKLKEESKESEHFLGQYITNVIACVSGKTPALCNPNTPIPNE